MLRNALASLLFLALQTGIASGTPHQFPLQVSGGWQANKLDANEDYCPQHAALHPSKHHDLDAALESDYNSDSFLDDAIHALSAVVRIPSASYDDMASVDEDPRWEIFATLHAELERLFPLVFDTLEVTKVNKYALVFHWKGSDESLKPVLLTAHMDVVPVDPSTAADWVHPPFSGHFDGTWLWGRGSADDKPDVVSILTSVSYLLQHGFTPRRTFVIAFGIDEESGGRQGAAYSGKYLEEEYGTDSFAALLDEGAPFLEQYGGDVIFALPYTAEKGYFDLKVEISTLGGHSSVPPRHTAIGMLASAIIELEAHPHETQLSRTGTLFQEIQCAASFGPDIPDNIKKLAKAAIDDDGALKDLKEAMVNWNPLALASLATTQAVDLIAGGVKVNALPEQTHFVVNHRIGEHSSVAALQERTTRLLQPVAERYNLSLTAFGKNVTAGSGAGGHLALSDAFGTALNPAPVTPTRHSEAYALLAGTIIATLEHSVEYKNRSAVVQPSFALGNTDTKHYWNLTKNIYRYGHTHMANYYNGAHTINEATKPKALVDKISFHTKFILNWDESDIERR